MLTSCSAGGSTVLRRPGYDLIAFFLGLSLASSPLCAATYTFTQLDYPVGASGYRTSALGINEAGKIVGFYDNSTLMLAHGFERDATATYSSYDYPVAGTLATGGHRNNSSDKIVGNYDNASGTHGFLKDGASYSAIDVSLPSVTVTATEAYGINDADKVVGFYRSPARHGFLKDGSTYTSFDFSATSVFTEAYEINNSDKIVGRFSDGTAIHGFLKDGATLTQLDVGLASSTATEAYGINDSDDVVGRYFDTSLSRFRGFVKMGSSYTAIDVPFSGATRTEAYGINNAGHIVGSFVDSAGTHGFLAVPVPEPAAILLAGLAGGLMVLARRRLMRS